MPRSRRIWAPRPISRHSRWRAASEPAPSCGSADTGTPAEPSRRIDDDAAAVALEPAQRAVDGGGATEDVAQEIGAVKPRRHVAAVADAAVHQRDVVDLVERRHIGIALERADLGRHREFAHPLDELLARLPVGDEIGDGDALEAVGLGEARHVGAAHHRAVVVHELGEHADRRQPGEPAQVDAGLGMARAHQHAAFPRHQRKHVAGADEIGGAVVAVGERAHGVGALLGGDAGGQPVADVDRDGEGGAERRVVQGDHRDRDEGAWPPRPTSGAQTMPEVWRMMKAIFSGVHMRRRDEQIALVLAVVVVGDDDDLAAREGGGGRLPRTSWDSRVIIAKLFLRPRGQTARAIPRAGATAMAASSPTWPRWRR